MFCFQASEAKDDANKISQYVPLDEDEHKEIDRTHNLNSARTFFYQGEAECDANMKVFIDCIDAVKGTKRNLVNSFWLRQEPKKRESWISVCPSVRPCTLCIQAL